MLEFEINMSLHSGLKHYSQKSLKALRYTKLEVRCSNLELKWTNLEFRWTNLELRWTNLDTFARLQLRDSQCSGLQCDKGLMGYLGAMSLLSLEGKERQMEPTLLGP